MKLLLVFIFIINISLFGYQFSEILPKNTVFYFALEDFKALNSNLDKLPNESFYKSKHFKELKSKVKNIISIYVYNEDKDMSKVDKFLNDFKDLSFNSFAFSIALDKFFKPQFSLIIDRDKLGDTFKRVYKELLKDKIKKGEVTFKKQIINGIKVDLLELKKNKANDFILVYGSIDGKFIITTSLDYMKILISTLKNKSIPKLSSNMIFKKDKIKYKKSDLYMFLDLKTVIKIYSLDKEVKTVIDTLSLKELKSVILYTEFDSKIAWYKVIAKLTSSNIIPKSIKDVLHQSEVINIPEFIPEDCYSFNAFSLNFPAINDLVSKFNNKKNKKRTKDLETMMGMTFKDFSNSIGNDFYYLNFLKNKKEKSVYIFKFSKPDFLTSLLRNFGSSPAIGMNEKKYLGASLFTATASFDFLGYAIGYINNTFITGDIDIVKEMIQKIGGKSGSFYNTKFYKKILSVNTRKQNILSITDSAASFKFNLNNYKKIFTKTYKSASTKKEMKVLKTVKVIIDYFNRIPLKEFRKYWNYSYFSLYIDKNELILEFKEIK